MLLLAVPAAAVVVVPLVRRRGRVAWAGLRAVAMICIVLAAAGARMPREGSTTSVCILADLSLSMGDPDGVGRVAGECYRAVPEELPVSVMAFGGRSLQVAGPGDGSRRIDMAAAAPSTARSETDVASALRAAAASMPGGARRVIILISDGRETGGSAGGAAARLATSGVTVISVPGGRPAAGDVFIQDMGLPPVVRAGRDFEVAVTVAGSTPGSAEVTLRRAGTGRVISRRELDLRWGESARIAFRDRSDGRGFVTYTAEIVADKDGVAANNTASAGAWVEGPSRILVVRPKGDPPSEVARLLRFRFRESAEILPVAAASWEPSAEDLERAAVVVIENGGAELLPEATQRMLVSFVRDGGGGLVMLGGPKAFGAGGLDDDSPLARVMAASPEPAETRRAHVVYCLDLSASMGRAAVGESRSKLDCAREAVTWSVRILGEGDAVSVVTFAAAPATRCAAVPAEKFKKIESSLARLTPKGGTDLLAGLEVAKTLLDAADAEVKHVLLLSDGEPTLGPEGGDARLVELAGAVAKAGGRLDIVGTSPEDEHSGLLRRMAKAGGGELYLETRPERLREKFRRIIKDLTREYVSREGFRPMAKGGGILDDLGPSPQIAARNRVSAIEGSRDLWVAPGETAEPVLSVARRGMGGSAVLATGFYEGWAGELAGWGARADLLGRIVESVEGASEHSVEAEVVRSDGGSSLELTVRDRKGELVDGLELVAEVDGGGPVARIDMVQIGLGRYAGLVAATEDGASPRRVVVEASDGAALARTVLRALPPVEITRIGIDRTALGAIARPGGGAVVETPSELAGHLARIAAAVAASESRSLVTELALAALVVFLVELLARALWRGES